MALDVMVREYLLDNMKYRDFFILNEHESGGTVTDEVPCESLNGFEVGKELTDKDKEGLIQAQGLFGNTVKDKDIYEKNLIAAKDLLNKINSVKDVRGARTKLEDMGITGSKISSIITGLNYSGKSSYSTPEGKTMINTLVPLLRKIFKVGVNSWSERGKLEEGMGNLKGLAAAGLLGMSQIVTPGSVFASSSKPPTTQSQSQINYKQDISDIIKGFENNKGYKPGGWNPVKKLWFPYDDHGKPAIGYGHDFDIIKLNQFENGISDQKADQILQDDIKQKQSDARKIIPQFDKLQPNIQNAIIVGMFRGDIGKHASPKTLAFINQGKWKDAANELRDSKDYRKGGGIQKRIESIAQEFEKNTP